MSGLAVRRLLYAGLGLVYLLHNDWWLQTGRLVLGVPVSLAYHVLLCLAAAVVLWLVVGLAWPRELEVEDDGSESP